MTRGLTFIGVVMCCWIASTSGAIRPEAQPAWDGQGKITITDYGYREWPAALLHYRVTGGSLKEGPVNLVDADGKPVPAQLQAGQLMFVAALPQGKSVSFSVADGAAPASSLKVNKATDGSFEIANDFYTVRLPAAGSKTFAAGEAPVGPITAWKPAGGEWMGATRFVTQHRIASSEIKVISDGPAAFEYEARYTFDPVGTYVCRIRVCPGIDYIDVEDEFDLGQLTEGKDFLLVELNKGFEPATIGFLKNATETSYTIDRQPFAAYMSAKLAAGSEVKVPVGGSGETPKPPQPESDLVYLESVVPAGKWGNVRGSVELRAATPDETKAPAMRVAISPMHTGSWRRSQAWTVWNKPGVGVTLALPVSTRQIRWYIDVADDISCFSTHEHDATLPVSYSHRQWALTFAADSSVVQTTSGHIGLDDYKNFVLQWNQSTPAAEYPRALFSKADIAEIKKSLDRNPDREAISKFYLISGKAEDAILHAKQEIDPTNGIIGAHRYLGNLYAAGLTHYRQSQTLLGHAIAAEDALACPELPADLRSALLRDVAMSAYLLAHPDINPRGAGVHLGNNNMSINRTCSLAYFAGLLPDHPVYRAWMDNITAHVMYKLGSQVAQDGADIEAPMYWLYGPYRFLDPAVAVIHNTGGPDLAATQAKTLMYLANLTMLDTRFNDRRIIPGMGNSGNMPESIFGSSLATVLRGNPDQAPLMQLLSQRAWPNLPLGPTPNNNNITWFPMQNRPDVSAGGGPLTTTIMPTYGVVFRDKFNTPDETAMLFRAGINWSHWDTDSGNVILYGPGGAPLSPGTGYQYYGGPASENEVAFHNQVKVGSPTQHEAFGRVDDAITDYGFGPNADYAVNSRYYPAQEITDGKGAMSWNRHITFLKGSEDYFVMHDTFPGGAQRQTWWTWLNLGTADAIKVDGVAMDKDKTPLDKVAKPEEYPSLPGHTLEMASGFGASTWMWFAGDQPLNFRTRLTFTAANSGLWQLKPEDYPRQSDKETKTILETSAPIGKDYLYVVFPKKDGQAFPQCESAGEHGIKVKTAQSTDYVFSADEPVSFDKDDVTFTGKAGAVRIFADRVALCMNAGSGKVGYKGMIFEGPGPFEQVIKLSDLKPGVTPVTGGYEKKRDSVDLGQGVQIDGEGPYEAKLDGHKIVLNVDGRARVIFVTRPDFIWQPWGTIDGKPSMICWTDYPGSAWGTYDRTHLMAVSVPDGKHVIEITERIFPPVWPGTWQPTIGEVVAKN